VLVAADQVETGCGTVQQVRRLGIFYCAYDATIYFAPAFRDEVVDESGPFGWTAVIAHEWGHHAQALLGIDAGGSSGPIDLELQADCLAAVFGQDQLARGEIGEDDVGDAKVVIRLAGDIPGTGTAPPGAHGSAAERLEWFQAGFDRGFAGCHLGVGGA
jgi:predicted metalloprotease